MPTIFHLEPYYPVPPYTRHLYQFTIIKLSTVIKTFTCNCFHSPSYTHTNRQHINTALTQCITIAYHRRIGTRIHYSTIPESVILKHAHTTRVTALNTSIYRILILVILFHLSFLHFSLFYLSVSSLFPLLSSFSLQFAYLYCNLVIAQTCCRPYISYFHFSVNR